MSRTHHVRPRRSPVQVSVVLSRDVHAKVERLMKAERQRRGPYAESRAELLARLIEIALDRVLS